MKTHYLFFFILILLYGCASRNGKQQNDLTTVSLPDLSFNHSLNLSSFSASIEPIPLETTQESLIGEIRNILSFQGRYYIKTGYTNTRILVFDEKGKFLYKIDNRGQGVGEYSEMGDFIVTSKSEIKVLAFNKVITYDSTGNYLSESPMPYYANKAIALPNDDYIMQHTTLNPNQRKILALFDKENKEKALFFETSPVEMTKSRFFSNLNVFSECKDQLYFKYRFCDTIFSIKGQKASPAFLLDFGKYKTDYTDVVPEDNALQIEQKVSKKKHINVWGFQVFPNYLMFDLEFEKRLSLCFYSLNTGRSVNGCQIVDDILFKNSVIPLKYELLPHIIREGYLLWPIPSSVILACHKQTQKTMTAKEWMQWQYQHPQLVTLCKNLSEEDNPVLMRIKMKD